VTAIYIWGSGIYKILQCYMSIYQTEFSQLDFTVEADEGSGDLRGIN